MVVLRVRGVRDSCVMVFVSGAYIETTDMFLPGNTSYGPRAMPHICHFMLPLHLYMGEKGAPAPSWAASAGPEDHNSEVKLCDTGIKNSARDGTFSTSKART